MESVPISSCFYVIGSTAQMKSWDEAINKLKADEATNPDNTDSDEQDIQYYEQLKDNMNQMLDLAAKYRASDNDPTLAKELNILNGRQQTLTQLVGLDTYIKNLQAAMKKDPSEAAYYEEKIANAQQQEQCIKEFQTAWEAYQQSGDLADRGAMNALIDRLQQLRQEDPTSPYAKNLIWEDFQASYGKYTILEFNGIKYAVV